MPKSKTPNYLPPLNRLPLVVGDVVRFDQTPINSGDTGHWDKKYGHGPFMVSKVLKTTDHYDHMNKLILVKRLSDGYLLPSSGDEGWWMGFFVKDEFLSAVKHAKIKGSA
jgi:hypothetical protein